MSRTKFDQAAGEALAQAVRDIERRIRKAEEQSDRELPLVERPRGVPASFEEHARLMFDLQLLAYQTDLTRVSTFMLAKEVSGRSYPEIGVADSHHPVNCPSGDLEFFHARHRKTQRLFAVQNVHEQHDAFIAVARDEDRLNL